MKLQLLRSALILGLAFFAGCTSERASEPPANSASVMAPVADTAPAAAPATRQLDVPYVPTHQTVVDKMLEMAEVNGNDILYDLGSGDGRIPITAAKRFGTRGVGIDLNPERIREANANAEKAKVTDKVKFIEGDLFKHDFSEATVLTLYLLPTVNMKLRPQILQMKPGTRVVSHNYDMGDWEPEKTEVITTPDGVDHSIYFWRVPDKK